MIRAAVAQVWGVGVAKACNQTFPTCSRCTRPDSEDLRKMWGCDEPADRSVWESTCPRCSGSDGNCQRCEGTGEVSYDRCPNAVVKGCGVGVEKQIDLLMRSYSHYDRRNVLPVVGAWLDQSRSYLACVDIIDAERNFWERALQEYQERQRKVAEMKSKAPRRGR